LENLRLESHCAPLDPQIIAQQDRGRGDADTGDGRQGRKPRARRQNEIRNNHHEVTQLNQGDSRLNL
jgi:hypothetical protein